MFDIPTYFEIVLKNRSQAGWKQPKHLSEGFSAIIYEDVKVHVLDTFFNKFYRGTSKGRTIYNIVQTAEIQKITFSAYIAKVRNKMKRVNYKDSKFDSVDTSKAILQAIEEATNLSWDIVNGLQDSHYRNLSQDIYLFLAEALYYAFAIQNNINTKYEIIDENIIVEEPVVSLIGGMKLWENTTGVKLSGSTQFSLRFRETLRLMTEDEVQILFKLLPLALTDEDEHYYLYAPTTDDERELYRKYGIDNYEFFRMKESGIINMGERTSNTLTVNNEDPCGFQNDNLVLAFWTNEHTSLEVEHKSYVFTLVGEQFLELSQVEANDNFLIDLASLLKEEYKKQPINIGLFEIDDMEGFTSLEELRAHRGFLSNRWRFD